MPYEFLEDVTWADSAFKAWGVTVEATFTAAADAVMSAMIDDLNAIQPRQERVLCLENEALDMLLFDLLQEFIYYKDAEQLLLRIDHVNITELNGTYTLNTQARGEPIDPRRHNLGTDVKAVTLHRFALEQTAQGWQVFVILDV
jgi:SHS2 domain-containing protein